MERLDLLQRLERVLIMKCNYYPINEISNKHVFGRTFLDRNPLPLFFNNSGIEVNCDGSELWIDVVADFDYAEPWIAYEINGGFIGRQMLMPGETSICLYRGMQPGIIKNVRFYRETQAINGETKLSLAIKGLKTDGNFQPVKAKDYRFEFIGDSITSGEGTYGALDDTEWIPMYMSSSRQYVNMIEKNMNADCRIVSHGGWGVYIGWDNDIRNNIPSVYEKVCGTARGELHEKLGCQDLYDFKSWQPDAVIINLATNDGTSFDQPPLDIPGVGAVKMRRDANGDYNREDILTIENAIIDFYKTIRKHNPAAHIVWAYGMLGSFMKPTILEAIDTYSKETNDTNVGFVDLPNTTPETIGSHGHPGVEDNRKAAKAIEDYLRKVL